MSEKYRILSLDGGGIRGIIPAVWLRELERMLGGNLRDHFDMVAGTSTGSILACAIASGKSAGEIVDMYVESGREVFPPAAARRFSRLLRAFSEGISGPKYSDKGLEAVLKKRLGENLLFGDLQINTLVVTYNTLAREAIVFKSFNERHKPIPVWEICKASCSAPTYFPGHTIEIDNVPEPYIDGGVVANNPTACAIAEGISLNKEKPEEDAVGIDQFVVASFGTGECTRPITEEDTKEWGAIEWAIPIVGVLFDGSTDAVHYVARQLLDGNKYYRFQARLDEGYDDMDNADRTNLNALQATAQKYLRADDGRARLERLAQQLKE